MLFLSQETKHYSIRILLCFDGKITFLPKCLRILSAQGYKDNFGAYLVKSSLREVRWMKHQSDYSLLDVYVSWLKYVSFLHFTTIEIINT